MEKKRNYALLVVSLSAITAIATYSYEWTDALAHASIDVPHSVDLGDHYENSVIKGTFAIRNRSRETLTVSDFRTSCGCIALSKATGENIKDREMSIRSGESLEVEATLVARRQETESFLHTIHFRTNDPNQPTVAVQLIGKVKNGLAASPREIHFGKLKRKESARRTLRLIDSRRPKDRKDFTITSNLPAIRVGPVRVSHRAEDREGASGAAEVYVVDVTATMIHEDGDIQGSLTIQNEDGSRALVVPVMAVVSRAWQIAPRQVIFPSERAIWEMPDSREGGVAAGTMIAYLGMPSALGPFQGAMVLGTMGRSSRRCICWSQDGPLSVRVVGVPSGVSAVVAETGNVCVKYLDLFLEGTSKEARELGDVVVEVSGDNPPGVETVRLSVSLGPLVGG
jgi:hypothetical protein